MGYSLDLVCISEYPMRMGEKKQGQIEAISEVLAGAVAAVERAGVPENLRAIAFTEVLRDMLVSANRVGNVSRGYHPVSFDDPKNAADDETSMQDLVLENEVLKKIERGTGVSTTELDRLIFLDEGEPRIVPSGLKLGKNNAERTRAVVAILTVARAFGFDEGETSLEIIREEVQRLRVYDSANFASHVKGLPGFVIKGTGANRRVQAKATGIEEFPDLVAEILQEL